MCDYCSWIEQILARINVETRLLKETIPPPYVDPTVIVHGGAGKIPKKKQKLMLEAVKNAALKAYKNLIDGYTAVDAIEIAISCMEDTLYLNYTKEAPMHTNDEIVWDAGIMTNDLNAGSIGFIQGIEHPIKLAREVLKNTDHVLIVENGATKLAKEADLPILMRKFMPADTIRFIDESEEEYYDISSSSDSTDDFLIKCANDFKNDYMKHKENDTSIIKMYFPECNFLEMEEIEMEDGESTELDISIPFHEVALMTISLWFMAWTPYLVINYTGIFDSQKITPIFTIWGSIFAKANAVYNPIVYGISHPKYRAALFQRFPSLACTNEQAPHTDATSTASGITTVPEGEKASA
ncbi:hypothetical protein HZH68_015329 [Vespula germanica]|uniref:G-protein coupled receptors family 1 profile domain-containing protein n=1 Tax=Vespula germanica TaxID=30212 RepID=A0A834MRG0_VESGE|nr:hypothetical protein HZH68_015329 [Vespula germanica]